MKAKMYFTVIAMLFISLIQAQAQPSDCPDGYNESSSQTITLANGCEYEVIVCYKCGSVVMPAEFRIKSIRPITLLPVCLNINFAAIYSALYTEQFYRNICGSPVGPCENGGGWVIQTVYSYCMEFDSEGYYFPCPTETATCVVSVRLCWNGSSYEFRDYSETPSGTPTCDVIQEPDIGDCFRIWTPCDD